MAIFFVGDYPRYYDLLSDPSQLRIASNNMSATCEALRTELQGVYALFSELSGDYSTELLNSFNGLQAVIETTMNTINNDLPTAVTAMEELHDDLGEMKPKDEDYEQKKNTFDSYKRVPDSTIENEEGEKVTNPKYTQYKELKNDLQELVAELQELVLSSDSEIEIINAFNDKVVEMRMKIASFEYATQNADFSDFASLTTEEKEAFIQSLIDDMNGRFLQYKEAYEKYVRFQEHMTDEQLAAFGSILVALNIAGDASVIMGADGEYTPFGWDFFYGDDDSDPASRGLAMLDLLLIIDQNNVLEKVDNYMVKGQSWQESGMEELYIDFYPGLGAMFTDDKEMYIAWIKEHGEDQFWDSIESDNIYFSRDNKAEIGQAFREAVDIFREDCEGFRENYMRAGNAAIACQGLKEMKKHIRYDELRNDPDFQAFTPTWDPEHNEDDAAILDSLWWDSESSIDNDYYSWMNDEEHATLEYLYNKDPNLAREYIESMDSTVKQRKGYTDARNFYDSIHEGDNVGFDAALDHLRSFGKGGVTGVYKFGENISSLFDPAVDYSQTDYMHMSMISMLSNGDSYDRGLLIAYNLGEASGEAAIPLVVGLFNKTAGVALCTAGAMGKDMRDTSIRMNQEGRNVTYEQLLSAAALKTLPTAYVKKFTGAFEGVGAPLAGKLVGDTVNATFKDSGQTIDMLYGQDATTRAMQYRMENADQSSVLHEEQEDGPTLASQYGSLIPNSTEGALSSFAGKKINGLVVSGLTDLTGNNEFAGAVGNALSPFTNAAGTATVKSTIRHVDGSNTALAEGNDSSSSAPTGTFGTDFTDALIGSGDQAGTKLFGASQTAYAGITDAYDEFQTGGFHPGD